MFSDWSQHAQFGSLLAPTGDGQKFRKEIIWTIVGILMLRCRLPEFQHGVISINIGSST